MNLFRVRLLHDVDRYPHFVAPAGAAGTVVDIGDPTIVAVRLDEPLAGAEEWQNEVHWSNDDDPSRDLEPAPIATPVEILGGSPSGYAVRDANGVYLLDGFDTAADARQAIAVELVLAALPADASPLVLVLAADRALTAGLGDAYIGSVPEGREFVADVLGDRPAPADRRELAAWLVAELTAE